MMRKLIVVAGFISLVFVSSVHANPDGVVIGEGDLHITGGGSLVFSDGSVQSHAQVQGPAGPQGSTGPQGAQGIQGPIGPQGPKGDTGGTTNGITKAVHGTFGQNGEFTPGNGFSVNHTGTGAYVVTFTTPFTSAPNCGITPLGHYHDINGYAACELSNVAATTAITITCWQYIPILYKVLNNNTGLIENFVYSSYESMLIDQPLTFICLQ